MYSLTLIYGLICCIEGVNSLCTYYSNPSEITSLHLTFDYLINFTFYQLSNLVFLNKEIKFDEFLDFIRSKPQDIYRLEMVEWVSKNNKSNDDLKLEAGELYKKMVKLDSLFTD